MKKAKLESIPTGQPAPLVEAGNGHQLGVQEGNWAYNEMKAAAASLGEQFDALTATITKGFAAVADGQAKIMDGQAKIMEEQVELRKWLAALEKRMDTLE